MTPVALFPSVWAGPKENLPFIFKETLEQRILRIADKFEPKVRVTLLNTVERLKDKVPIGTLTDMLEDGNITGALDALSGIEVAAAELEPLRLALIEATTVAAEAVAVEFALDFAIVNQHAVRYASETAARLIVSVSDSTRQAVRDVVARSITEGVPPRASARVIRELVGLTPRDALALRNMTFARLAAEPAKSKQIIAQHERLARRRLKRRGENIARTETMRASNMGTQIGWNEAAGQGLLPASTEKVWIAAGDERTCPICSVLHGTTVGFQNEFAIQEQAISFTTSRGEIKVVETKPLVNPTSEMTPPAHPSCRCTIGLKFSGPS